MMKLPVARAERALRKSGERARAVDPVPTFGPFLSFRASYTEISSQAGSTRVKSRRTRFEDGKLTTETFEGELEHGAFEPLVQLAQRQFAAQMALLLQPLTWFLPASRKRSSDGD